MSRTPKSEASLGRAVPIVLAACLAVGLSLIWSQAPYRLSPTAIVSTAVLLVIAGVAPLLLIYVMRRVDDHEHRVWAAAALAASFLFLSEASDIAARIGSVEAHTFVPSVTPLAFLAAALFGVLAAQELIELQHGPRRSVRDDLMDVGVVILGLALLMLTVILPVASARGGIGAGRGLLLAAYPSLAIGLLVYIVVFKRARWTRWQVFLVAWPGALGARHVAQAMAIETGGFAPAGSLASMLVYALLMVSYTAVILACTTRLRQKLEPRETLTARYEPVWASLVAPTGLLIMAPFFYWRFTSVHWGTSDTWIAVALGALIGLITTARSYTLTRENTALRRSSTTDPLTGLHNHRFFHEQLSLEVQRAKREGTSLSVAVFDVDDFARINNIHGHAAGDRCLQAIAERLTGAARASDVLCRVGGDGFALIMPDADPLEAYKVCLRAQTRVHEQEVIPCKVGLSAGIAALPAHAATGKELAHKADGALYWAKSYGREQVVIFDPDLVRALGPEERIEMLEEEAYLSMVKMLASAVDARDPHTQRHSRSVADLAVEFGTVLGLEPDHVKDIKTAALLHDVGKIGVPDAVLGKPGRLTTGERALLEEHPELAARILNAIPKQKVLPWIVAHHERFDGAGYPAGLAGEEIPFEARIISLCDSYDAMTSDRPYRKGLTLAEGIEEILAHAGTQFDPELARQFAALIRERLAFVPERVSRGTLREG